MSLEPSGVDVPDAANASTAPVRGSVACRDAEIHYLRWGASDGRPVVLLTHGLGFVGAMWCLLARSLARDFTVYAIDRRDHGRSQARYDARSFAFEGFAADVVDLADGLGIRAASAVAHSVGATDVLLAAGARADLFARILAIEPTLRDPRLPFEPDPALSPICRALVERTRNRPAVFADRGAARRHFGSRAFAGWHPEILDAYVDDGFVELPDGKVTARCQPALEAQMLEPIFQTMENRYPGEEFERLTRIQCPVTIFSGDRSEWIYGAMAQTAALVLPISTHRTIAGGTHYWPLEQPERLLEEVVAFLAAGARS